MPRQTTLIAVLFSTCFAAGAAFAQTPPLVQEYVPADPRKNQKVERIHTEDTAVIIDEVRYAGETRSVTIQPKGNMPEYELTPTDMARTRPGDNRDGLSNANGKSVWNVLKF